MQDPISKMLNKNNLLMIMTEKLFLLNPSKVEVYPNGTQILIMKFMNKN